MTKERLAEIKQVHASTAPYHPTVTAHGHRGELIKEVERLQEILRRTEIMLKDLAEKHLLAIRAHLGMAGMGYTPIEGGRRIMATSDTIKTPLRVLYYRQTSNLRDSTNVSIAWLSHARMRWLCDVLLSAGIVVQEEIGSTGQEGRL